MHLSSKVDCQKCPKLCCYSLSRQGYGFADPTDKPKMCTHCDIIAKKGCRIHHVLSSKSRVCASYTCHGVGMSMVEIFQLEPDKIPSLDIQRTFRHRQGIAFYLIQLKTFLDENNNVNPKLFALKELYIKWEKIILHSSDDKNNTLEIFVLQLNFLMTEYGLGYDNTRKEFCML